MAQAAERDFETKFMDLSTRDLTILKHIALGETTKGIAAKLGLSPKTAEFHISGTENPHSLAKKLGTADRTQMARFAVERGLVTPGEKLVEIPSAKKPVPEPAFKNVEDLKGAVLKAATRAANHDADPIQVSALCSAVDAYVKLLRVQLDSWVRTNTTVE